MNENILIGLVEELRCIRKSMENLECSFRQLRKENAKQHKAIEKRLTKLEDRVTNLEDRMTKVEDRMTKVEDRMTKLEDRMTKLEDRMTKVEGRMTKLEDRVTNVENIRKNDVSTINEILYTFEQATKNMIQEEIDKRMCI